MPSALEVPSPFQEGLATLCGGRVPGVAESHPGKSQRPQEAMILSVSEGQSGPGVPGSPRCPFLKGSHPSPCIPGYSDRVLQQS